MSVVLSIHIDAPVEKVFDQFRDPSNWQDLAEGIEFTQVHVTSEGLGTHYAWRTRVAGITIEGFDVFTEFVPFRRITDMSSLPLEGNWTYSFEPEGAGTKLTLRNRSRGLWRLPLLEGLVDRMTATSHRRVLTRIKARVEAAEGTTPGRHPATPR